MSYKNSNDHKISQLAYSPTIQHGSKKNLFEQITLFAIIPYVIFKLFAFLWPKDVDMTYTDLLLYPYAKACAILRPDVLLSLLTMLRTYPAITGVLLSFITWHIMYFDSAVPGINPPTPLSPTKYRAESGADFHLNYMFAILVGPLVATLLYTGWMC